MRERERWLFAGKELAFVVLLKNAAEHFSLLSNIIITINVIGKEDAKMS